MVVLPDRARGLTRVNLCLDGLVEAGQFDFVFVGRRLFSIKAFGRFPMLYRRSHQLVMFHHLKKRLVCGGQAPLVIARAIGLRIHRAGLRIFGVAQLRLGVFESFPHCHAEV